MNNGKWGFNVAIAIIYGIINVGSLMDTYAIDRQAKGCNAVLLMSGPRDCTKEIP